MIPDMQACRDIFWERPGDALPISEQDYALIIDQWPAILDGLCEGTLTFTHYDYRVENMFFSADESEVAVIDWQLIGALCAGWDLAYLLSTNILTEQRRANEQQYIDLYLQQMAEQGVQYSETELRHDMKWSLWDRQHRGYRWVKFRRCKMSAAFNCLSKFPFVCLRPLRTMMRSV